MAEIGEVIDIKNTVATVKLKRVEACAKCKACTQGMTEQEMLLRGKGENLSIGDTVSITLSTDKMLTAVYVLYGVPLLAMLLGFFIGFLLFGEIGSFLFGMFFLGISYISIKLSEKKRKEEDYMPIFTKI